MTELRRKRRWYQYRLRTLLLWTVVVALYLGILRIFSYHPVVSILLTFWVAVLTCWVAVVGVVRVRCSLKAALCVSVLAGAIMGGWTHRANGVGSAFVGLGDGMVFGLLVFAFVEAVLRAVNWSDNWLAARMEKARRQKEAVEAIRELGGGVFYDYHKDEWSGEPIERPVPRWTRALPGDHFFFGVVVVAVAVHTRDFGDDEASHLKALTNLTQLDLSGTQITDAGLEHLKGLTRLRRLSLLKTEVTPEGVKKLKRALPACEIVY